MNLNNISDQIVFKSLKFIEHGNIKLINYDGKIYDFGNSEKNLKVEIKINKPGLTYQIIKSGSVGLAEAYMRGDFETNNLPDLIELTAKNIKLIYKFSGLFDFSYFNNLKRFFMENMNWNYPTTIWFGNSRINDLHVACNELNIKRPLIVTDPFLAKLPMVNCRTFRT